MQRFGSHMAVTTIKQQAAKGKALAGRAQACIAQPRQCLGIGPILGQRSILSWGTTMSGAGCWLALANPLCAGNIKPIATSY
jgi:hypothetical protein